MSALFPGVRHTVFICICNAYRERDIAGMAQSGVHCARQAYAMLGSGPRCGQCLKDAQALIDLVHGGHLDHQHMEPRPLDG